jgi:hypothetical protein
MKRAVNPVSIVIGGSETAPFFRLGFFERRLVSTSCPWTIRVLKKEKFP